MCGRSHGALGLGRRLTAPALELGEGHSVGHFSTPAPVLDWGCHLWRDRKRARSSYSQCWWRNQCVVLEHEVVRVRDPSLLLDTPLSFTPEFSPSSSLLPPESWFWAIHVFQSPPARSALCSDPACHHLSECFLGYRRDLLPALPPLLWLSPLLLHTAAWVKVWLHSPFTAFLLSFWANSNHHHHNYTDSTLDQGLETGWSYKSSFTREGFWTCSGRHWDPHKDDVGRRYVFALPASITLSEPAEWLAFKLLCFPVVSAMLAATTGPLHMLFEYLKTTDLFAVSSCLASHWLA